MAPYLRPTRNDTLFKEKKRKDNMKGPRRKDRDEVEVHKPAKKERGQYPAILTSHLVNNPYILTDLLYGFRDNFACGIQRVVPSWQDGFILPSRVANHSAQFGLSCPLTELAM